MGTDLERVRAVVSAQLQAFAEDDAEAAFAVASPSVRDAVGDSARFLDLVRGNYPMVYRPAGIGFLPLTWASLVFGWGLAGIWTGLTLFMLVRLAAVTLRTRSGRWAVAGAVRA